MVSNLSAILLILSLALAGVIRRPIFLDPHYPDIDRLPEAKDTNAIASFHSELENYPFNYTNAGESAQSAEAIPELSPSSSINSKRDVETVEEKVVKLGSEALQTYMQCKVAHTGNEDLCVKGAEEALKLSDGLSADTGGLIDIYRTFIEIFIDLISLWIH